MSLQDDFLAALQSYADSSGSVYLRQGLGAPGNYVVVRYETVATGQAYTTPGFMVGLATALSETFGGHVVESATPVASFSVQYRRGVRFAWGAPTAVELADLTNGAEGQIVALFFTDAFTTIVQTGNINLASGASFTGAAGQSITFMHDGTDWHEIARAI